MNSKIKIDNIDCELFLKHFFEYKSELSIKKKCSIEESSDEDSKYFKSPIDFNPNLIKKANISEEIKNLTDLYPANICLIDYILKEKIYPDNFKLLDFGCGIPNLLHHLFLIGFQHLYGYDNCMHVEKKYIDEFILNTGLNKDLLVNLNDDRLKEITAISYIGCAVSEEEYNILLSLPNLKYIFADYRFTPVPNLPSEFNSLTKFEDKVMIVNGKMKNVPESIIRDAGFEPSVIYDGLLLIYKKTKK